MFPILLKPFCNPTVWGKNDFAKELGINCDGKNCGETVLLQDKKSRSNILKNSDFSGKNLNEFLNILGREKFLGKNCRNLKNLPLKISVIDTKDRLPVEVADKNSFAGYELVYIAKAAENAKILYGFTHSITPQELREKIKSNRIVDICNILSVQQGDVFAIPSGTPWALGKDITAVIIRGLYDKKYCIFDYGRTDASGERKPLEIEKAMENIYLTPPKAKSLSIGDLTLYPFGLVKQLSEDKPYISELLTLNGNAGIFEKDSFVCILCLEGEAVVSYPSGNMRLKTGSLLLVPAGMKITLSGGAKIISTYMTTEVSFERTFR